MQQEKKPACRGLRCLAKCVGALLLLAIIAWTGAYLYTSHELDSTIGNLERAGYATSLPDLAPPPVPAEETTTEAYKSALAAFDEITVPEKHHEVERLALLPENDLTEIGTWLEEHREAIDMIESAGDPRKCRFGWKYETGYAMEMKEIALVIRASKAACLRAEFSSLRGNQEKARKTLSAVTDLYLLFESEPVLVAQLVRIVVHGMIFGAVDRCITAETGEKELEAWLEFVDGVPPFAGGIQLGFRGELAVFAALIRDPSTLGSNIEESTGLPVAWGLSSPLVRFEGAFCLRKFRRLIEISRKPYLEAYDELVALEKEISGLSPWQHPLTALIFPTVASCKRNEASTKCHRLIVRSGILCELSRLREGKYPAEIGDIDPLTGKTLAYSPQEGWIRSSDEENRTDNQFTWKLRQTD